MILKLLFILLKYFIELFLLYIGIVYIFGIFAWVISLFTRQTIKLSEVLMMPFKKKSAFPKTNNLTKKGK